MGTTHMQMGEFVQYMTIQESNWEQFDVSAHNLATRGLCALQYGNIHA